MKIKPVFDWSKVPRWANWVAMDKDGKWFAFKSNPSLDGSFWWSGNKLKELPIQIECHWQESLIKRPNFGPSHDKNVEAVRLKMLERAETGLNKYGVSTERKDLTRLQWLQHAQDEAMDLAVYLQKLIDLENQK